MRCLNYHCEMFNPEADCNCSNITQPDFVKCRSFITVGLFDTTTYTNIQKLTEKENFKKLENLFRRMGWDFFEFTKEDEKLLIDLFPTIFSVIENLKGD